MKLHLGLFVGLVASCFACGGGSTTGMDVHTGSDVSFGGDASGNHDTQPAMDGTACGAGHATCAGVCVDTQTDDANCGACGAICAGGATCVSGVCGCAGGHTSCGGACVDTQTDMANCGACGVACGAMQMCTAGVCTVHCASPSMICPVSGTPTCVDVTTDANNCGACGVVCASGTPCTASSCGCNAPFATCGTMCVNTTTDSTNCGHCGNVCAGGTVCTAGLCQCPIGMAVCGGTCIDVESDASNCGACGNVCATGMACVTGVCACGGSDRMCGSHCTDVTTDDANCGACGNTCAGGTTCVAGACACPTGTTLCAGACLNTSNDAMNCGACAHACATGAACVASACTTTVDVTVLIDITGSDATAVTTSHGVLPGHLTDPLLALTGVNVGVSYTGEYPVAPYGGTGDHPFTGVIEPNATMAMVDGAITTAVAMGGGDAPDGMVGGLAPLGGLPVDPTSVALTCMTGRVAGGCWRPTSRRFVVLFTDDIFHNAPDPANPAMLYSPYSGITPAPPVWSDVATAFRASSTMLFIMNSNAMGTTSLGAAQYPILLSDLGQPATDAYDAHDMAHQITAADAIVARIRALTGL